MNGIPEEKKSSLLEYLESRDIEAVLFDIDNTLLVTNQYYRERTSKLGRLLADKIDSKKDPEVISKEIIKVMQVGYKKEHGKPRLIDDRYIRSLEEYLQEDVSKEIEEYILEYFKEFYHNSPSPYEAAPSVLKTFFECNVKIALHSHAQEEWTKIKVNLLEDLVGFKLPYLSTPIDKDKDSKSWLKACQIVNSKPENTLVVGDNFTFDILPSIEAGSRSLVWVDLYRVGIQEELKLEDDVQLIVINDIKDLIEKLSNQS